MSTFTRWVLLLIGLPFFALAQLQITHPMPRLVVQRAADGNGRLYLSGRLSSAVDRVEAQLTPVNAGQGTATGWQVVQTNPTNNIFLGYVTGAGGWYVLNVRTIIGGTVISQASVQPVGIGEVFVTAGQSNSRGLGIGDNDLGTATDRVNAIDSINHEYPKPDPQPLLSSGDPMPVPVYKPLTAGRKIFPMAESSWGWGELGDYIVNRYNVPVAFYVAGWDGSTVENWYNTANGIPTCNRYFCNGNWPNLQPYTNLKNVLHYYNSIAGIRAILWHQGEAEYNFSDASSIPYYYDRLVGVIQKSRQDFGGRSIPWMVARASFDGTTFRPEVVSEQQRVIDTPGLNVYQGPYNDTIVNRYAGASGVHFGNSYRPSPHPRYYLNPSSIPVDMGLSRFARNWNNSLNNSFFQNSQPIIPTQFAVTGTVADYVRPGDNLSVTFATTGTFGGDNQWQVQLLDSVGHYISVLGSGTASPISVKIPDNLQIGAHFQVRVVATSPFLPAVPSNLFQTSLTANQADVSLAMSVNQRLPDLNSPVTINLSVQNSGPGKAQNVVVRNRLPDNLAVISTSGLSLNGSVLTSNALNLDPGTTQLVSFVAQPTAGGVYTNAAEIAQATSIDPDSQPNSGTGDGQDDMAVIDFRTKQTSASLFTSPNPNQVPLPSVQSNQPTPDPAKADISLQLTVSNRAPSVNDEITYTITLSNAGGLTATGLSVTAYLPGGQQFVPGDDLAAGNGGYTGGISSLAPNSSYTFRFKAKVTGVSTGACTAQLTSSNQPDPDSTPNNGTTNGEDDTAQVDIRVR